MQRDTTVETLPLGKDAANAALDRARESLGGIILGKRGQIALAVAGPDHLVQRAERAFLPVTAARDRQRQRQLGRVVAVHRQAVEHRLLGRGGKP